MLFVLRIANVRLLGTRPPKVPVPICDRYSSTAAGGRCANRPEPASPDGTAFTHGLRPVPPRPQVWPTGYYASIDSKCRLQATTPAAGARQSKDSESSATSFLLFCFIIPFWPWASTGANVAYRLLRQPEKHLQPTGYYAGLGGGTSQRGFGESTDVSMRAGLWATCSPQTITPT